MSVDAATITTIPRLEGESNRAYEMRVRYVTMGPQRSIDKVGAQEGNKRASGRITQWSQQFDWAATARAWDDQRAAEVSAQAAADYRARLEQHRADAAKYGEALCGVAVAMLAQLSSVSKQIDYSPAALATIARALTTGLDLRAHALDLDRLMPSLTPRGEGDDA